MFVKYGKLRVDVADRDCLTRPCFQLGFDKGSFTPGRGYTSYYKKERPVCMTRHVRGCPINSRCPVCNTVSFLAPGQKCNRGASGCFGIMT